MSEFAIHLSAFRALQVQYCQQQIQGNGSSHDASSPANRHLNTVFFLQSTLSLSTNCDLAPTPWPSDPPSPSPVVEALNTSHPGIDEDCLQYTYGTTKRLTTFIRAIATLFRSALYYTRTGTEVPNTLNQAIQLLNQQLQGWTLDSENIINFPYAQMEKVLKLHILAFYHAACIFALTHLVLPLLAHDEARQARLQELHLHVSQVLSHLQTIETIKRQNLGVFRSPAASILWPGFIACCEARREDRPGWIKWWEQMLTYRIGNIASLYETVKEVWRLHDREETDGSLQPVWRVCLKERKRVIIAL
ncbi:fungal-specific transcription factor domain-containing protein [Aspergillus insuetus]